MLQARPVTPSGRQAPGLTFARLAARLIAVILLLTPDRSTAAATNLWSLEPLPPALKQTQTPPVPKGLGSSRNPIDAFVQAKLHDLGLASSPEADKNHTAPPCLL